MGLPAVQGEEMKNDTNQLPITEEQEKARQATARAYARSPEGQAIMRQLFDQVRGRPLAPPPEPPAPVDPARHAKRWSDAAEVV